MRFSPVRFMPETSAMIMSAHQVETTQLNGRIGEEERIQMCALMKGTPFSSVFRCLT